MRRRTIYEVFGLSAKERVRLAKELLQSVTDENEPRLTAHEQAILDERLADDEAHPDEGLSWAEVRKRLRPRRGSTGTR